MYQNIPRRINGGFDVPDQPCRQISFDPLGPTLEYFSVGPCYRARGRSVASTARVSGCYTQTPEMIFPRCVESRRVVATVTHPGRCEWMGSRGKGVAGCTRRPRCALPFTMRLPGVKAERVQLMPRPRTEPIIGLQNVPS